MGPLTRSTVRQSSHQRFVVADSESVGAVRRTVAGYAERLSGDATFVAAASRTATELGTNLLRHAHRGGWMLVRPLPPAGVEIIAVDRGPGIRDVAAALAGRSAAPKGLGCGLAAARSASAYFDVHTGPDRGTVVLAIVEADRQREPGPPRAWAGVSVGLDEACGDGWGVVRGTGDALTVAVVDGVGHGVPASLAADAALGALADDPDHLDGYLARANAAMRGTRGAALALCEVDTRPGELRCLSVGNVNARLVHRGGQRGIVAFNGTVGARDVPPAARITHHPWPAGATLVMWTDGLASRIDLTADPDLLRHDPAVVAAALHRDHSRDRDDATVIVLRDLAAR